jgi:hypothetical protein
MSTYLKLSSEEEKILQRVCDHYQVKDEHLKELIEIEIEYSLKASARRLGIKQKIKDLVSQWVTTED